MEEPNIVLVCAVCRQSNRLKKSIKTTWKSSEAFGKTLLRGRGMCSCGTDGHISNEKGPKVMRARCMEEESAFRFHLLCLNLLC